MTLSKERLQELAVEEDMYNFPPAHEELNAIARELLALRKERAEAVPVFDADKCDPDVFEKGTNACLVVISKENAETICRGISAATGCKVDWHYVGGRVQIKALYAAPPAQPVAVPDELVELLISAIEKEQERLFGEDYLMDSKDCVDVIREESQRINAFRVAMLKEAK